MTNFLHQCIENNDWKVLTEKLLEMSAPEIATLLESLPQEPLETVFHLLPDDLADEVFCAIDHEHREYLMREFNEDERISQVRHMLDHHQFADLQNLLIDMTPQDIAVLLEELPSSNLPFLYRLLPKELAAEVFVELDGDNQELLIKAFSDREIKEVFDELYLDDAADIVEEMPATVVRRIINQTDPDTRKWINEILNYPKDCVGSIMTIEYVDLKGHLTVADAFTRIRTIGLDKETIYTCYVTDANRKLLGYITAKDLMLADQSSLIRDIMEPNILYVSTLDDQENAVKMINQYDLLALPVVDGERRLVGIVTIDDAMDVMQEKATEDIEIMSAITPSERPYLKSSVFGIWAQRIPWLLLLMVSATFTGAIIGSFENALQAFPILTAFIPMLMDTGGNAGSQASVTVIRGLAVGDIKTGDILRIVWKECRVSILCGITLALAGFLKILLIDNLLFHSEVKLMAAAVICITMAATVFAAKLVGCSMPILAKKLHLDPAVMASPFITTMVDAISLMIYFNVATRLLHL